MSQLFLNEDVEFLIKVVLVGDSGVGKSNLLLRYCKNEFNINSKATIGTDFYSKDIHIKQHLVKVQFWDTAGQEKYRSLTSQYYKECHGIVLVYDISNSESFEHLQKWLMDIKENVKTYPEILLLGNKTDLVSERSIKVEEGQKFAKDNNMKFMEVSALSNDRDCVNDAFEIIIQDICEIQTKRNQQDNVEIISTSKKNLEVIDKKSSCCQ